MQENNVVRVWKQNDTSFKEEWNPNKIVKISICEHTSYPESGSEVRSIWVFRVFLSMQ